MTTEAHGETLAAFCALLPALRRMTRGPASAARRALVERAVRAARAGEPIDRELAELGLDASGMARIGAGDTARGPALPPPVESEYRPATGVYLCPLSACPRVETRRAGADLPRCDVHELALTFVADG
ncbi:hypothetical protein [Streptomyces macrosporus]|uniref:Uncharacterized protein n=1 Tax=Streptomyces macrosporus TaxID=44032 RepID=A0ABP5XQ67_9ACTN